MLGANFLLEAQSQEKSVAGVYHQHPFSSAGIDTISADLTERSETRRIVSETNPRWIVHCAAVTNVDLCEEQPDLAERVHVQMTRNLIETANEIGARIVYVSTDSVFDGERGNYHEDDPPAPRSVYARTKLAGEKLVHDAGRKHLIVRTNIFGWNAQPKQSLAEWILSRLESGITVPGFVDAFFNPILVNDLAGLILEMMDKNLSGLHHVAGSERCSKHEFARRLARTFGQDENLIHSASLQASTLRAPRPRDSSLNTDGICRLLGRRMPTVDEGLQHFKALRHSGFVATLKH